MDSLSYFACFPKIDNRRLKKLADYFANDKEFLAADFGQLVRAGLKEEIADELIGWREKNPMEKIGQMLAREGIWTVSVNDDAYPKLLKQIIDPPIVLFVRGELPDNERPMLGVVGTRRASSYGRLACEKIVRPLAEQGLVIVSGLAFGVDTLAHEQALAAKDATLAVLGGGIDRQTVYPHANSALAERITKNGGALISEYPPFFKPAPYTFPARNRIVAGLTTATLVIEAPAQSGALITAGFALDYNRDVLVVPHQFNSPNGEGGNRLIKYGAKVITCPEDVLEVFDIASVTPSSAPLANFNLTPVEEKIFSILNEEPKHIDLLIAVSTLSGSEAAAAIAMLEIKNLARNVGGMRYIRS